MIHIKPKYIAGGIITTLTLLYSTNKYRKYRSEEPFIRLKYTSLYNNHPQCKPYDTVSKIFAAINTKDIEKIKSYTKIRSSHTDVGSYMLHVDLVILN